jgi:hypothetical protein
MAENDDSSTAHAPVETPAPSVERATKASEFREGVYYAPVDPIPAAFDPGPLDFAPANFAPVDIAPSAVPADPPTE